MTCAQAGPSVVTARHGGRVLQAVVESDDGHGPEVESVIGAEGAFVVDVYAELFGERNAANVRGSCRRRER